MWVEYFKKNGYIASNVLIWAASPIQANWTFFPLLLFVWHVYKILSVTAKQILGF